MEDIHFLLPFYTRVGGIMEDRMMALLVILAGVIFMGALGVHAYYNGLRQIREGNLPPSSLSKSGVTPISNKPLPKPGKEK